MTTPLNLEQRILIAADYNADRVEVIKELMEEVAVGLMDWLDADTSNANGEWTIYKNDNGFPNGIYTTKQLYEIYLLQSNKQVKP